MHTTFNNSILFRALSFRKIKQKNYCYSIMNFIFNSLVHSWLIFTFISFIKRFSRVTVYYYLLYIPTYINLYFFFTVAIPTNFLQGLITLNPNPQLPLYTVFYISRPHTTAVFVSFSITPDHNFIRLLLLL